MTVHPAFGNITLVTALVLGASLAVACEDKKPAEPEATPSAEPAASAEPPKEEEKAEESEEEEAKDDADGGGEEAEEEEEKAEEKKEADTKAAGGKAAKPTEKKPEEKKPEVEAYSGPNPCKRKSFAFGSVKSACNKGGQAAAKDLMRVIVKKARDGGEKLKCTSCHSDTKSYANTPNAVADFRKWLTAK